VAKTEIRFAFPVGILPLAGGRPRAGAASFDVVHVCDTKVSSEGAALIRRPEMKHEAAE
jgi:hypothetical protein